MVDHVCIKREDLFTVKFLLKVVGTGCAVREDHDSVSLVVCRPPGGIDAERRFTPGEHDRGYPVAFEQLVEFGVREGIQPALARDLDDSFTESSYFRERFRASGASFKRAKFLD